MKSKLELYKEKYNEDDSPGLDAINAKEKELYGITSKEYIDLREKKYTAKELLEKHKVYNPLLITDLNRK